MRALLAVIIILLIITLHTLYYSAVAMRVEINYAKEEIKAQKSLLREILTALASQNNALSVCRDELGGLAAKSEVRISAEKSSLVDLAIVAQNLHTRANAYETLLTELDEKIDNCEIDHMLTLGIISNVRDQLREISSRISAQSKQILKVRALSAEQVKKTNYLVCQLCRVL